MQNIKQGAFSGAAQSGAYNHAHAATMAHAAASRRQIASTLGGVPKPAGVPLGGLPGAPGGLATAPPPPLAADAPPPLAPPVAAIGPPLAAAPGMSATPPGMAPGAGLAAPPHIQKGNFKVHIAHQLKTKMGVKVTHNAVLSAIDRQAAGGGFTPFQAQQLKQHNGPLQGVEGKQTMTKIAMEILKPTQPVVK